MLLNNGEYKNSRFLETYVNKIINTTKKKSKLEFFFMKTVKFGLKTNVILLYDTVTCNVTAVMKRLRT